MNNMTIDSMSQTAYWLEVIRLLAADHGFGNDEAFAAVRLYRDRMRQVGAEEVIYHWEAADTAQGISGRGYLTPPEDIPGTSFYIAARQS